MNDYCVVPLRRWSRTTSASPHRVLIVGIAHHGIADTETVSTLHRQATLECLERRGLVQLVVVIVVVVSGGSGRRRRCLGCFKGGGFFRFGGHDDMVVLHRGNGWITMFMDSRGPREQSTLFVCGDGRCVATATPRSFFSFTVWDDNDSWIGSYHSHDTFNSFSVGCWIMMNLIVYV